MNAPADGMVGRHGPDGGTPSVAVVIPCFQVSAQIPGVLARIGPTVDRVYCVDDASTDATAEAIRGVAASDPRVVLVRRPENGGVGAATMDGYRAAIADGCRVIVKLDGDGQMDPAIVPVLVRPILSGEADYVKGNRFQSLEAVRDMPRVRLWGNAILSFFVKASTGYWTLFDPNNGLTAVESRVAAALPLDRIHRRYFFESDILFRLGTLRARVVEVPMVAYYGDEDSHLSIPDTLLRFPFLHTRNLLKRLFYNHLLRNFSLATVNLVLGLLLAVGGAAFGAVRWAESAATGVPATAGTVMLSALPVLVGIQLILSFLAYDMAQVPDRAVHPVLDPLLEEAGPDAPTRSTRSEQPSPQPPSA
ncbi:MAG TPA: glycosyltransferase family 2 protein [Longimicrobiales bacterium]|nr:glycosyltransferase family 2 protein [Longimicrobiales bacterium]